MKVFASLDVGTSKIVALIGELDSQRELHVMSKGEVPSRGVDRGSIIFSIYRMLYSAYHHQR